MSIKISKQEDKTVIELSNGHSKALGDIMEKWNIKSEEDALGFALSVLMSGDGPDIFTVESGKAIKIEPNDGISMNFGDLLFNSIF